MAVRYIFALLVLAAAAGHSASQSNQTIITVESVTTTARCEKITLEIPTCVNVDWENTSFPNLRDHQTQAEAYEELEDFNPLIKAQCSNKIVHFLCGVYAPPCLIPLMSSEPVIVKPCRSLCEYVRNDCEPQLEAVGYSWPSHISCDNFETGLGCLDVDDDVEVPPIPGLPTVPPDTDSNDTSTVSTGGTDSTNEQGGTGSSVESDSLTCPGDFVQVTVGGANNTYSLGGYDGCAVPCEGMYFTDSQRNIVAPVFIMLCAFICIGFTLFTVGTFLIDRQRFHYPERPVIFLAMCYLVLSVAYIVGTTVKLTDPAASFACSDYREGDDFVFQRLPSSSPTYHSASCVILFIIVYYFQMAAAIWWVMLTLTWFLASTLKWGEEAIERPWILYQIFSWSIPAIQVIFVLAFQLVDGDQLSGLCYTGNFSNVGSGVFVLLPLIVYLVLGILFLVIGFVSLVHIRLQISKDPVKSNRLQRLIIRICVYSLLYIIPNVLMLCLIIYEVAERNSWERAYAECNDSEVCSPETEPRFVAFLLRYLMLFMTGIFSTFWVISLKTFIAWKRFFSSIFCCQQEDL